MLYQTLPPLALAAVCLVGCVTPIEIKTASEKQLELIKAVDKAIKDLDRGLADFHRQKAERIREEGRILIARQAIDVMVGAQEGEAVSVDLLFEDYTKKVQPWLDYAFAAPDIQVRIASLTSKIESATDPLVRARLQMDLEDFQLTARWLDDKPDAVKELEAAILQDLEKEARTLADVQKNLKGLRAQLSLMKAMATHVDRWLAIDVTVSQEQADSLVATIQKFKESRN